MSCLHIVGVKGFSAACTARVISDMVERFGAVRSAFRRDSLCLLSPLSAICVVFLPKIVWNIYKVDALRRLLQTFIPLYE